MVKNYTKLRAWAWLTFIWSNAQTDLSSEFKEDRNIDENYYFDLGHFWWSLIKPKFNYTQSLLCLPMSQHIDSATRPNQKKTSLAKYRFHKQMSNKGPELATVVPVGGEVWQVNLTLIYEELYHQLIVAAFSILLETDLWLRQRGHMCCNCYINSIWLVNDSN